MSDKAISKPSNAVGKKAKKQNIFANVLQYHKQISCLVRWNNLYNKPETLPAAGPAARVDEVEFHCWTQLLTSSEVHQVPVPHAAVSELPSQICDAQLDGQAPAP